MRTYGQYCPIARGAEIFAERWTPIIVRNLLLGCRTFTEIHRGAPGLSRTLLTQRLKLLERSGIVERRSGAGGRNPVYALTAAGEELRGVCDALGEWGARWLDVAPEQLDPYVVLWAMCNYLKEELLPPDRVLIRFVFPDFRKPVFWLLIEERKGEVCLKHPGFDEDLVVTADSEAFALWHMGRLEWSRAVRAGRIRVEGPRDLARAFPTWNALSHFANVRPARSQARAQLSESSPRRT